MGAPRRFRLIFTLSAEKILLYLFEKAKPKAHFHTRVFFFHIIPYSTVKDTQRVSLRRGRWTCSLHCVEYLYLDLAAGVRLRAACGVRRVQGQPARGLHSGRETRLAGETRDNRGTGESRERECGRLYTSAL